MSNGTPILKLGKHQPRYPLIQGGMGVGISGPRLAGNVARCGAVGTVASVGLCHNTSHFSLEKRNYFEANQFAIKDALAEAREIAGPEGVLALLEAIYVLSFWVTGRSSGLAPGWSSLMFVLLFVGGTIMVSLGILGAYLGYIFQEVKRRPIYLIRKVYGAQHKEQP